jgi:iron complex outermembrane recepter protein
MRKLLLITSLFISTIALAQKNSIEGTIYDENQTPLPSITIQLDGTKLATATDSEGHFYINNVPEGDYILIASGIGYSARSKSISMTDGSKVTVDFKLTESTTVLQEVTILEKRRLAIGNTNAITRTNTPVHDLPQSIQSVSRVTINDQQLYRVDEALKNVAGVNLASAYGSYNFRGFTTNSGSFLTNGMKGTLFPEGVSNSLANVESIEVLRGPSAILYGENALGGTINFTTKQPKKTSFANASVSTGSFDLLRAQADITGSLNKTKSLYYVAGFGAENGGKITRDWKNQNLLLFAAVKWEAAEKTSVQFNANYNYDNSTSNYAIDLPFIRSDVFSTPADFNIHGSDASFKGSSYQLQTQIHHKLNNNWGLHLLAGYAKTDAKRTYYSIGDYVDPNNDFKVERSKSVSRMQVPTTTLNLYTTGAFNIGNIKNTLTVGGDYNKENGTYPEGFRIYAADSISVTNPNRAPFIPAPGPTAADFYYSSYEKFTTETMGAYLQNQFAIGGKWKGILGLRYNHYFNRYKADSVSYNNFETYEENPEVTTAVIPRFGLVYQPIKAVSIYADYNSGFVPQYSNNRQSGGPFEPETSHQFEVGVKGEFLNGRLVPTLAAYHINKNNVLTPDLNDPNGLLLKALGQVRSKGFESTLTGSLTTSWDIILNYSYNETLITKSNDETEVGQVFANNPKHIASVWATYSFTKILPRLKIGLGLRHTSERYIRDIKVDNVNPVILPSYTVADVMVQYGIDKFTLTGNLNNVFDENFIQGSYQSRSVFRGAPKTFLLTLAYRFNK